MKLTLIDHERYGGDDTAINKHSVKTYQDEAGNLYQLNRTLDGVPPFFEAYGPYKKGFQGILPRLKVAGQDYWGNGISWNKAEKLFHAALRKTGVES